MTKHENLSELKRARRMKVREERDAPLPTVEGPVGGMDIRIERDDPPNKAV
jgi:hypothetical protein